MVVYPQDTTEAEEAIRAKAAACGCEVFAPDFAKLSIGGLDDEGLRVFAYDGGEYRTRLLGSYQPYNAALAIAVARVLSAGEAQRWTISDNAIVQGICDTVWPGRFEVVEVGHGCAAVVVDGGHNPQGAQVLAQSLQDVFSKSRIVFLMSVLADKDYHAMIRHVALLGAAWVCVTSPNVGRALSGEDLAKAVRSEVAPDVLVETSSDFEEGMVRAKELAGEKGVVCAWGSLYSLSELKHALAQRDLEEGVVL